MVEKWGVRVFGLSNSVCDVVRAPVAVLGGVVFSGFTSFGENDSWFSALP